MFSSFVIFQFLNVMVLTLQKNSLCVREVTHVDENTNPGGRGALFVSLMQSMSTDSRVSPSLPKCMNRFSCPKFYLIIYLKMA